jgi:hypothetical protein
MAAVLVVLASSRVASAYPQFQFSTGTSKCSQCHYAPAGGGLLTSWGRDESGETISLGGDGAFLHGLWTPPSWLGLGLDFRYAGVRENVGGPEPPDSAWFPMQADLYGRAAFTDALSLNVTVGARGIVRPVDPSLGGRVSDIPDRLISPNHYLMWRPSATGPYFRVGRFFAPYGLRFVEHIFYVRRYTGFNLYEETYNLSGGYMAEDYELHVTAFAPVPTSFPDFLGTTGPKESGGAAYFEKRFAGMAALAGQTRIGLGDEQSRYEVGALGKVWIDQAHVLLQGEGDYIRQQISGASFGQNQFVSFIGATGFMRGFMATAAYERFQSDLSVRGTARVAYDLEANFFPWAHIELVLLGRYQVAGVANDGRDNGTGSLLMFQFHYYM